MENTYTVKYDGPDGGRIHFDGLSDKGMRGVRNGHEFEVSEFVAFQFMHEAEMAKAKGRKPLYIVADPPKKKTVEPEPEEAANDDVPEEF